MYLIDSKIGPYLKLFNWSVINASSAFTFLAEVGYKHMKLFQSNLYFLTFVSVLGNLFLVLYST